ncbi:MAG: TauD/TfdA family dioxygenase [Gammaproteobacteria bacterium]|nr:TauD/TfdA family dioxygenase [Gammaproteobacteria bacterium]
MTAFDVFQVKGDFPAIITSYKKIDYESLISLITTHRDVFHRLLLKHGALLFRGFPVASAAQFANFIENLKLGQFVNYIGGDSPRDKVEDKVYTSTEAPPALLIPLHQELSFMKKHPRHIYFFCEHPPAAQGETIIGDARRMYQAIHPEVRQRFEAKGLQYTSNYYYESKVMQYMNKMQRSHKSWTEVFETRDRHEVETRCLSNEFEWRWSHNDWLNITQTRPATISHPETAEKVWFNQAHLYDFNPRLLGWPRYVGAKLFYFRPWTRLHEIRHADGSKVARKDLYHILEVLQQETVATPWEKSDVMVLDNILAMHGRAPFKGSRRVLTALTS